MSSPKLRLPMLFSESLQYLVLHNVDLLPRFDWTELMNLTKLHMFNVGEFNKQNFIEFIRRRPKLKFFYLYSLLDDGICEEIGEALGKYCGDQIEYFNYHNNYNRGTRNEIFYNFLSEFKIVKKVGFSSSYRCASELMYAIKWLAENDTIDLLVISIGDRNGNINECPLQIGNNKVYMKQFTKLRTIEIHRYARNIGHTINCKRLEIFSMYSVQILSNVETIKILFMTVISALSIDCDFIKFAPKLRVFYLLKGFERPSDNIKLDEQARTVVANLKIILQGRKNERNKNDFIELNVDETFFDVFRGIDGIGESIKLIKLEDSLVSQIRIKIFSDN